MAGRTLTQRIALEGGQEIARQFADLGKQGAEAFRDIEKAGQNIKFDRLQQSATELGKSLQKAGEVGAQAGRQVNEAFANTGKTLDAANEQAGGFGSRFLVAAGIVTAAVAGIAIAANAAIKSMVDVGAKAAGEIQETADKLGVATDEAQILRAQIEAGGANFNQFVTGLDRIGQAAIAAAGTVQEAAKPFRDIKIATEDGEKTIRVWGAAAQQAAQNFREITIATADGERKIRVFGGAAQEATKLVEGAAGALQRLGINLRAFGSATAAEQFEQLRAGFARITSETERQSLAVQLWGKSWRDNLATVAQSQKELDAERARQAALNRNQLPEETANLNAYRKAYEDLGKAVSATTGRLGAIFAPGQTASLEFLTRLIDGSREWLLTLARIKTAQIDTFFRSPDGETFVQGVLETLRGVGADLVNLFQNVLVPLATTAGQAIAAAFDFVAEKINQVFGTEITGRFLAVATAVASLTGAFGLLRLAATPIVAVVGLLSSIFGGFGRLLLLTSVGAAAFWTSLRVGAVAALNAIRARLPAFQAAFAALFKGDFRTAWAIFQREAVAAFAAVRNAVTATDSPLRSFFASIARGAQTVRGVFAGLAAVINTVFGTKITGDGILFATVIGSLTGVFSALAAIIVPLVLVFSRLNPLFLLVAAAGVILYRVLGQTGQALESVRQAFANFVSGQFLAGVRSLGEAFTALWNGIKTESAATWAVLLAGALLAFNLIRGAALATWVAIGGPIGAIAVAFGVVAFAIVAYWDQIRAYAEDVWASITNTISETWDALSSGAQAAWDTVVSTATAAWDSIRSIVVTLWDGFVASAEAAWNAVAETIRSSWESLTSSLRSLWNGFVGYVESSVSSVLSIIDSVVSRIQSAISAISSFFSSAEAVEGSTMEGFASGGYIRGRGTSTSDSILARLSNGEYVMRAAAVRKFGPSFFAALNSLRLPQFATGGLAGAMAMPSMNLTPSFELPGSGPALRPLAVTIGGQTFDMMAPEDTAQSLMRFATVKQIRSNGRKPSWHGG